MCQFLCRAKPEPDHVCLEIRAAGGKLSAALTPPIREAELIAYSHVPLLRAVKMAKLMGDVLHTDVDVVDHVGLWDEWLLARAFEPDIAPSIMSGEAGEAAIVGVAKPQTGWTGALHAPSR